MGLLGLLLQLKQVLVCQRPRAPKALLDALPLPARARKQPKKAQHASHSPANDPSINAAAAVALTWALGGPG